MTLRIASEPPEAAARSGVDSRGAHSSPAEPLASKRQRVDAVTPADASAPTL